MSKFLLLFFTIYGSMNAYVFAKVRAAAVLGATAERALLAVLCALVLMPLVVVVLDRPETLAARGWVAAIGHPWMGLALMFVCFSAALDLGRAIGRWGWGADPLSATQHLVLTCVVVLSAFLWGLLEAQQITVERVRVISPRLAPGSTPIRIVQLTDLHLGLSLTNESKLPQLVAQIAALQPDVFVSTGDLVDGHLRDPEQAAKLLRSVPAPLGRYAVTGNHEFLGDIDMSLAFLASAGFRLLHGETVDVGERLRLVGVDDPIAVYRGRPSRVHEADLLASATGSDRVVCTARNCVSGRHPWPQTGSGACPPTPIVGGRATVLLKHVPDVDGRSVGQFDLQLSGHTHHGQIMPFQLVTWLFNRAWPGLADVGSGSWRYLSRGTGTWGPPIRVFAPPEITLIELAPATAVVVPATDR